RDASFRFDVRRRDDRPPLLDFSLLIAAKRLRRLLVARGHVLALIDKSLPHGWIGQRLHDRSIERADDVFGRALRDPKPMPERNVDARHPHLVDGRNVRPQTTALWPC